MIGIAAVLVIWLIAYAFLQRGTEDKAAAEARARFEEVLAAEKSLFTRALLRLGKVFGGSKYANLGSESPSYEALRLKLAASGNKFGGFVEIFMATQIAATIVGASVFILVIINQPTGSLLYASITGGVAAIAWPYSQVWEAARKRSDAINTALPEFAELLLMPLNSGYGILPALDFTAERLDGPVADEIVHLLENIKSRSMNEEAAFLEAGDYLGTPAAKSFFAVLAQAYLEGVRVAETIQGQATQLRKTEHERLRERIAKAENSIAVMTGIHLLPGLFLVILYPALTSITGSV